MFSWLRYYLRWPKRLYWLIILLVKVQLGRWYVFRDAPDWVVFEFAEAAAVSIRQRLLSQRDIDNGLLNFSQQAIDECLLRLDRMLKHYEQKTSNNAG